MPKIERKMLLPEAKKEKGFGDLFKIIEASPNRATFIVMGMEIAFGRLKKDGEEYFPEISRSKESQISGETYIPKKLYAKVKNDAIAAMNDHLKREQRKKQKQQLKNRTKKQQPDLF